MERYDCWDIVKAVLPVCNRVLLHGEPGTGKTYAGQRFGLKTNKKIYNCYLTEYTPVTEVRGSIYPTLTPSGERKFEWVDGPALEAYRNGGRLVINEIDKASDDTMTFLLALLDDREVSSITLPTREIIRPNPEFTVVATMNVKPMNLPEALRSRFPVSVHVNKPNPEAVSSLSEDLQVAARSTAVLEDGRGTDMRQWITYDILRFEIAPDMAAQAIFGSQAEEILNAFTMSESRDEYR